MRHRWLRRPRIPTRVLIGALLAVALIFGAAAGLPLVVSLSWSPLDHFVCRAGPPLASERLWTPRGLLNSPYGGNSSVTVLTPWGTELSVAARNGSAVGLFQLADWNVSAAVRTLVVGAGDNAVCPEFLAIPTLLAAYAVARLLPENVTSDAAEPTNVTLDSPDGVFESVIFQNGYAESDIGPMDTCGPSVGGSMWLTSSHVAVGVPFVSKGANYTVPAVLDVSADYWYGFPASMGRWSIDDLNTGSHGPGGGFAFAFAPCG